MFARVATAISWLPVGVLLSDTLATIHITRSDDMHPHLKRNTPCLIRRTTRPDRLSAGDVVAVHLPDGSATVLRRLVALPGSSVIPRGSRTSVYVPYGFVWVEPDTTSATPCPPPDSHITADGRIPIALITGRASHILPSCTRVSRAVPNPRAFPPHIAPPHELSELPVAPISASPTSPSSSPPTSSTMPTSSRQTR